MNRTRLAGHAWTAFTLAMICCAVYVATFNLWLVLPAWGGAACGGALASGCYLRAVREAAITRRLTALRSTLAPAEEQAWADIVNNYDRSSR